MSLGLSLMPQVTCPRCKLGRRTIHTNPRQLMNYKDFFVVSVLAQLITELSAIGHHLSK
jgi:hypothetical protein